MNLVEYIHEKYARGRRVHRLAALLTDMLPKGAKCLDVGCGAGELSCLLMDKRPDVSVEGIDVLVRDSVRIPVTSFDGKTIPFPDRSHDVVLLIDVLHHTDEPRLLLQEARRVARRHILIKDHLREGWLAGPTLKFMDVIANRRFNVRLPCNYLTRDMWRRLWTELGLKEDTWNDSLALYPWPLSFFLDRSLHFIVRLEEKGVNS